MQGGLVSDTDSGSDGRSMGLVWLCLVNTLVLLCFGFGSHLDSLVLVGL